MTIAVILLSDFLLVIIIACFILFYFYFFILPLFLATCFEQASFVKKNWRVMEKEKIVRNGKLWRKKRLSEVERNALKPQTLCQCLQGQLYFQVGRNALRLWSMCQC